MKFSRYSVIDGGHLYDTLQCCVVKEFKSNKYLQCRVYDDDNNVHIFGVHQMIARLCCEDWFEGCIVHHKDGNTINNLECFSRSYHSRLHIYKSGEHNRLRDYVKSYGPANKGQKMSKEFRKHCSESAKKRGFNGNQYTTNKK